MELGYALNPAQQITEAVFLPVNYLEFLTFCSLDWYHYGITGTVSH